MVLLMHDMECGKHFFVLLFHSEHFYHRPADCLVLQLFFFNFFFPFPRAIILFVSGIISSFDPFGSD